MSFPYVQLRLALIGGKWSQHHIDLLAEKLGLVVRMTHARKLIDRIAGNNWRIPPGIVPDTYTPPPRELHDWGNEWISTTF